MMQENMMKGIQKSGMAEKGVLNRAVSAFLADESGEIPVSSIAKLGAAAAIATPVVFGAEVCSEVIRRGCSCSPGCGDSPPSCHANTLNSENANTEFCGLHCHQIIQGGPCPDDDDCGFPILEIIMVVAFASGVGII